MYFELLQREQIRTLKSEIYKYMTATSKNVDIDKLDSTVNKYSNTYHNSIKMNPVVVKNSTYIDHNVNRNDKNPALEFGDRVRISKYKNIFTKGYTLNWSEEFFIKKS